MLATGALALVLFAGTPVWETPTALPSTGLATYYTGGAMEWVWGYRIQQGDVGPCKECIGAVAMMRSGDIGRKVWIENADEVLGPFMVVDCASPVDFPGLVGRGVIIELPYWLATRWNMKGPVEVRVLDRPGRDYPARH